MADYKCARPFTFSDATGKRWEVGIALYPSMSDEFVNDWYIQSHSEATVLAAGRMLYQQRDILAIDPATGNYVPFLGARHAILLSPSINPEYSQTIEPGWTPLFLNDCDCIHLDNPPAPLPPASPPWLRGWKVNRDWAPRHDGPVVHEATRLYPGDPSPPISKAVDGGNLGRAANEDAAHFAMQTASAAATRAIAARYVDQPSDAKPITPPTRSDQSVYTYVDPRQIVHATAPPQQRQPLIEERLVADYNIANERTRARLERRPVQPWAR